MKRAVYAGSFDPITNGHLWMIEQGTNLFDDLVVAIGVNPDKKYTFSLADRLRVILRTVKAHIPHYEDRVTITHFENQFLVNYASSVDAQYVLRGIRNAEDYEFERGMRHVNSDLESYIKTVFLMPPREFSEISSSLVKGLIGPSGWEEIVKKYVPEPVYDLILSRR